MYAVTLHCVQRSDPGPPARRLHVTDALAALEGTPAGLALLELLLQVEWERGPLQDGAEQEDFPPCDVAFLGGSDPWRRQWGAALLQRAREEGLRTHVGQVNSAQRVQALRLTACDSVDGTYVGFRGVERGVQEIGQWLGGCAHPLFVPQDFATLAAV